MNEGLKTADRWYSTEHECPYCGQIQPDDCSNYDEYCCEFCGEDYILGPAKIPGEEWGPFKDTE